MKAVVMIASFRLKVEHGRPLINLETAGNAAYALYHPEKYHNVQGRFYGEDSRIKHYMGPLWQMIILDPLRIILGPPIY